MTDKTALLLHATSMDKELEEHLKKNNKHLLLDETAYNLSFDKQVPHIILMESKEEIPGDLSITFQKIKSNLYDTILEERLRYKKIYDIVEAYVKKNNLLISNLYKVSKLENLIDELYDYRYDIYCERPFEHATEITNAIFMAHKDDKMMRFLNLRTVIKNEEFLIEHDTRVFVRIFAMQKYKKGDRLRVINAVEPYYVNNIPYMPPEIEIIDVYQKLYNGKIQHKQFENILFNETKARYQVTGAYDHNSGKRRNDDNKHHTKHSRYDRNNYRQRSGHRRDKSPRNGQSRPQNQDQDAQNHDQDAHNNVQDADGHATQKNKTCYEKKKDVLEALKIALIKDFLKDRKDIMLIGPMAYSWYSHGKDFCPMYDRLQVISTMRPSKLRQEINNFLAGIGQKYTLSLGDNLDLMIPKDFRTNRQIFSINIVNSYGIKTKPFLEYFNTAQFDVLPGMVKDGVLLAQKEVLLRFLFIDLWVAKFVYVASKTDNGVYEKRVSRLWNVISGVREIPNHVDGFLGVYQDYDVAKKQLSTGAGMMYGPYYPYKQMELHGELRSFKSYDNKPSSSDRNKHTKKFEINHNGNKRNGNHNDHIKKFETDNKSPSSEKNDIDDKPLSDGDIDDKSENGDT